MKVLPRDLRVLAYLALSVAGSLATATEPEATAQAVDDKSDQSYQELFNGQDLTGWEGQPGAWRVEEGLLVGESTADKPCKRTHYLFWTGGELSDFELRVVFRIHGEAGNSGVQIRSERRPHWDAWGCQADLDTAGQYTGCVYQHERGLVAERGQRVAIDASGKKHVESLGDRDELLKAVRRDGWNEYRIIAKGPAMTLWINDTLMCDVEDHDEKYSRLRGQIALQMHQGPPMKIEYRSVRLRLLGDRPAETTEKQPQDESA